MRARQSGQSADSGRSEGRAKIAMPHIPEAGRVGHKAGDTLADELHEGHVDLAGRIHVAGSIVQLGHMRHCSVVSVALSIDLLLGVGVIGAIR